MSQRKFSFGLRELLTPYTYYEARRKILDYLSAYDAAKLDECLHFLSKKERNEYLNPIRDIIWNVAEMNELLSKGMQMVIFGRDVPALKRRVQNTSLYLQERTKRRRLKIFLVGTFPLIVKTPETRKRMLNFSISGNPCAWRTFTDDCQLRKTAMGLDQNSIGLKKFIMAFGAPADPFGPRSEGAWIGVPDIPDVTIDLKVYIPSFEDRYWGKVNISPSEIPQICSLKSLLVMLGSIRKKSKYHVEKAFFKTSGIDIVQRGYELEDDQPLGDIRVRFRWFPIGCIL